METKVVGSLAMDFGRWGGLSTRLESAVNKIQHSFPTNANLTHRQCNPHNSQSFQIIYRGERAHKDGPVCIYCLILPLLFISSRHKTMSFRDDAVCLEQKSSYLKSPLVSQTSTSTSTSLDLCWIFRSNSTMLTEWEGVERGEDDLPNTCCTSILQIQSIWEIGQQVSSGIRIIQSSTSPT